MNARLYIEGGGDSKADRSRCREGFSKLLGNAGLAGSMPRLIACGGRDAAFDDFKTAHASQTGGGYVAMLVDSEDPVSDLEKPWDHLKRRDQWDKPAGAADEQALLMTTCMASWISADHGTLRQHYAPNLQESALLPTAKLESRSRTDMHDHLVRASRNCSNAFAKGKRSFEILGKLDPAILRQHLPSFARVERILLAKLIAP